MVGVIMGMTLAMAPGPPSARPGVSPALPVNMMCSINITDAAANAILVNQVLNAHCKITQHQRLYMPLKLR